MKIKDMLRFILYFGAVVSAVSYIFFKADLIPDIGIVGFMDDALLVVALLFVLNWAIDKLKLRNKNKKGR